MHKSVTEFNVRTIEVAGIGPALLALRLPFGKEARSEYASLYQEESYGDKNITVQYGGLVRINPDDIKLISALINRGDEHAKVLRGICVWCEINAPRYWWQEMATYRIGCDCLSSESTMHVECKGMPVDELVEAKEHIEEGHMQKRVMQFSYQTLRRIYNQRCNHRLPQWKVFCDWIASLPLSESLIFGIVPVAK